MKEINEKINQKTLTPFLGTYMYSSPEMRNLVYAQRFGSVNLYKND